MPVPVTLALPLRATSCSAGGRAAAARRSVMTPGYQSIPALQYSVYQRLPEYNILPGRSRYSSSCTLL